MRLVALVQGCVALTLGTRGAAAQAPPVVDQAAIDALVAEGVELAKTGQFSAAIERWKRADQTAARAKHACLIGQAYARRELWPQAEIFFAACRARATASEPLPPWLDTAERELNDKLAQASVAAVTLAVTPVDASARFKVSSFAPDETFGPRVIHLGLGQHTITATTDHHPPAMITVEIDSTEPRTITIPLDPTPLPPPDRVDPPPDGDGNGNGSRPRPPPPSPRVERGLAPWLVLGAGGALTLAGGVYHATALRGAWRDLETTTDLAFYEGEGDRAWRAARRNTIILYSAAAATIVTGVVLRSLGVGDRRETAPALSISSVEGGGLLNVGWSR